MARFVISAKIPKYYPSHSLPEFSLVGASIQENLRLSNSLAKAKVANVSKKPGKTKTLNFYDFEKFWLVDTPGYGYAYVDKKTKDELFLIIDSYFSNREGLVGVCQLCSTHGLSELDLEVKDYLTSRFDNYLLLLNKVDKLSKQQQQKLKDHLLSITNLPKIS